MKIRKILRIALAFVSAVLFASCSDLDSDSSGELKIYLPGFSSRSITQEQTENAVYSVSIYKKGKLVDSKSASKTYISFPSLSKGTYTVSLNFYEDEICYNLGSPLNSSPISKTVRLTGPSATVSFSLHLSDYTAYNYRPISTAEELQGFLNELDESADDVYTDKSTWGYCYLTDDISFDSTFDFDSANGISALINLNGHTVSFSGEAPVAMMCFTKNVNLCFKNGSFSSAVEGVSLLEILKDEDSGESSNVVFDEVNITDFAECNTLISQNGGTLVIKNSSITDISASEGVFYISSGLMQLDSSVVNVESSYSILSAGSTVVLSGGTKITNTYNPEEDSLDFGSCASVEYGGLLVMLGAEMKGNARLPVVYLAAIGANGANYCNFAMTESFTNYGSASYTASGANLVSNGSDSVPAVYAYTFATLYFGGDSHIDGLTYVSNGTVLAQTSAIKNHSSFMTVTFDNENFRSWQLIKEAGSVDESGLIPFDTISVSSPESLFPLASDLSDYTYSKEDEVWKVVLKE